MSVADVPEVLGVVVEVPGGAGEDLGGGDFEEDGIDDTVLVVFGLVRQARDEAVDDKGEEKMFVVNVVQGEHRAAVEEKLIGEGLKAEVLEGDAQGRLGTAGAKGQSGKEEEKPRQLGAGSAGRCRDGGLWNRHDT